MCRQDSEILPLSRLSLVEFCEGRQAGKCWSCGWSRTVGRGRLRPHKATSPNLGRFLQCTTGRKPSKNVPNGSLILFARLFAMVPVLVGLSSLFGSLANLQQPIQGVVANIRIQILISCPANSAMLVFPLLQCRNSFDAELGVSLCILRNSPISNVYVFDSPCSWTPECQAPEYLNCI